MPRTVELFLPVLALRNCLKVCMLILSVVLPELFLPAGVGSAAFFPTVTDFFPFVGAVAAFLDGVNLSTFSTVLVAGALVADFLADLLAALVALFPEAPPLTLGAAAAAAGAFFAAPPRATTLVVPSLKCQSSFPATMFSPFPWRGCSSLLCEARAC